uniref:Uncharacterized protein n=1 Tax=Aegilops tauschii subsp. strangulata TaxID=200361 RepID=A0A453GZL5_AEGTS
PNPGQRRPPATVPSLGHPPTHGRRSLDVASPRSAVPMSWRGRPPATGEDEGDGRVSARVCAARCGSGGRRRKPAATVDGKSISRGALLFFWPHLPILG